VTDPGDSSTASLDGRNARMDGRNRGAVDVSAIIVNWNTCDLLDLCLESLHAYAPRRRSLEIVVVDNGSADGSADLVRTNWPDVVLEVNTANEGYTRANNRAIGLSRGRNLLLINSDAQVGPGSIDTMLERLEADARAAVVGPRLVYGDGSWQRWTAGRAPDLASVTSFFLFAERFSASATRRSLFLAEDVREPFCPDWVCSACMLVRREALDQVGLMDERYFCYMDDVDLCQRFRDAGWRVWYDPSAEVVHLGSQSNERQIGRVSPAAIRNFNDYFTRRNGAAAGAVARAVQVVGYGSRAVAYAGRSLLRPGDGSQTPSRDHLRNTRVAMQRGHV
jgi:N-acetylglucosaminyl-diphospho-decaprenol L-rhamnosyltransferase